MRSQQPVDVDMIYTSAPARLNTNGIVRRSNRLSNKPSSYQISTGLVSSGLKPFTFPKRGDIDGVLITQEEFRRLEDETEFLNDSIIDAHIKRYAVGL